MKRKRKTTKRKRMERGKNNEEKVNEKGKDGRQRDLDEGGRVAQEADGIGAESGAIRDRIAAEQISKKLIHVKLT